MVQTAPQDSIGTEFLRVSRRAMMQRFSRIEECVLQLTTEQIWSRGSEVENSVSNLALHLAGNVRQWILARVEGASDTRNRDEEFAQRTPIASEELLALLRDVMGEENSVLSDLTDDDLFKTCRRQDYAVTVLHAITHVVTHFAKHAGQIIYLTMHMTRDDLGLYCHLTWKDTSVSKGT